MNREHWNLTCTKKAFIDLNTMRSQITNVVTNFGGRNVQVSTQSFSFDWPGDKRMTIGQRAELGRCLAKIEGLGCYADVYIYTRKDSQKSAVSRQLFRAANM